MTSANGADPPRRVLQGPKIGSGAFFRARHVQKALKKSPLHAKKVRQELLHDLEALHYTSWTEQFGFEHCKACMVPRDVPIASCLDDMKAKLSLSLHPGATAVAHVMPVVPKKR